jgi:hypothetical protein
MKPWLRHEPPRSRKHSALALRLGSALQISNSTLGMDELCPLRCGELLSRQKGFDDLHAGDVIVVRAARMK